MHVGKIKMALVIGSSYLFSTPSMANDMPKQVYIRHYSQYMAKIDCQHKSVMYELVSVKPISNPNNTPNKEWTLVNDSGLPTTCQSMITKPYQKTGNLINYTRQNLISTDYLGQDELTSYENLTSNTVPRPTEPSIIDAWTAIDKRVACLRTENYPSFVDQLIVITGPIWQDKDIYGDPTPEDLKKTYGVEIPKALWKIVVKVRKDGHNDLNAWIIPNNMPVRASNLDRYLTTAKNIATQSNNPDILNYIPKELHKYVPTRSMALASNCHI